MTTENRDPAISPTLIAGILIVAFGVALLLDNLGQIEVRNLFRYWPLILIVVGLAKALQDKDRGDRTAGAIMAGAGTLFAIEMLVFHRFDVWRWWPLAVVGLGLVIVVKAFARPTEPPQPPATSHIPPPFMPGSTTGFNPGTSQGLVPGQQVPKAGSLDSKMSEFAIWSGVERRVSAPNFKRADLTAVMGGIEFDLRQAGTDGGEAVIEVFVLWGGVEITVPPDWAVSNQITAIMGGAEDKSTGTQQSRNRLIVKGVVIMGGVDIKT